MCSKSEKYHQVCQHYGKPTASGEPCIRATVAGTKLCWDTIDLGVESVRSLCPKCAKESLLHAAAVTREPLSRSTSFSSDISGTSTASSCEEAMLDEIMRVRSNASLLSTTMSDGSTTSNPSNDGREHEAQSRDAAAHDLEMDAFVSAILGSQAETKDNSRPMIVVSPPNLHWRTFGGSEVSVRFKRGVGEADEDIEEYAVI